MDAIKLMTLRRPKRLWKGACRLSKQTSRGDIDASYILSMDACTVNCQRIDPNAELQEEFRTELLVLRFSEKVQQRKEQTSTENFPYH